KNIKPTLGAGRGGGGGGGEPGGEAAPAQFGAGGARQNIINPIAGKPVQFNWNSPIRLSPHNPSTVYLGGRTLYVSRDRGNTWWSTKELGKGIDLTTRQIMGVSYALPSCSGGGGGGGGGRGGAGPGQPCILSKNDGYTQNEF